MKLFRLFSLFNLPQVITVNGKGTITYKYDAAGNKLAKITVDNTVSPAKTTTIEYIGGIVYQNNELQFVAHEEGRIRIRLPKTPEEQQEADLGNFVYEVNSDWFIKDHLGNVRMVLTNELKTDVYRATMEASKDVFENQLFSNRTNLVTKPTCFDNEEYPDEEANAKVQRIGSVGGGGSAPIEAILGAGITLKVMAGDKVDARVFGWFNDQETGNTADPLLFEELMKNMLVGGLSNVSTKGTAMMEDGGARLWSSVADFFAGQPNYESSEGAYLNWILLDEEQLKFVDGGYVSLFNTATGDCEGKKLLQINDGYGIEIPKNGYLYIYLSNTNDTYPVYFDDLHIEHTRGPLLEETHYYPFGLSMNGISSKAASFGNPENKIKFQNQEFATKEFSDGGGLDMYEFKWRMADPQTGRFWQIDPLANEYVYNSTYAFSENKVISHVELEGLEAQLAIAGTGATGTAYTKSDINAFNARAQRLKSAGFTPSQASTGDAIVNTLVQATAAEGSVGSVVIFAHGGTTGIFLNNDEGFYTQSGGTTPGSANVSDIRSKMNSGEIKFDKNAVIVLGTCNSNNTALVGSGDGNMTLATSLALETGVPVVGATGNVYPEVVNGKETGRLKTDGTFQQVSLTRTEVTTTREVPRTFFGIKIGTKTVTETKTVIGCSPPVNLGNTIDPLKAVRN